MYGLPSPPIYVGPSVEPGSSGKPAARISGHDTCDGNLDIVFSQIPESEATSKSKVVFARDAVEASLWKLGKTLPPLGYFEFSVIHEVTRTIGIVRSCAPELCYDGATSVVVEPLPPNAALPPTRVTPNEGPGRGGVSASSADGRRELIKTREPLPSPAYARAFDAFPRRRCIQDHGGMAP